VCFFRAASSRPISSFPSLTFPSSVHPLLSHSDICPHSFEKEQIHQYLSKGPHTCPVSGCSAKLDLTKIKVSFFASDASSFLSLRLISSAIVGDPLLSSVPSLTRYLLRLLLYPRRRSRPTNLSRNKSRPTTEGTLERGRRGRIVLRRFSRMRMRSRLHSIFSTSLFRHRVGLKELWVAAGVVSCPFSVVFVFRSPFFLFS